MPMLLPSTGLRLPEGDWDTFGPQVPPIPPQMLPLARQATAPPVEVTATPPKFDNPYGPLVLAARKRLEEQRAQPQQSFYSPEQAQEDKRREALGMLGAISADPNLRNVGGMVLKQAMGKRDPIYREHGVIDPATGKYRMFPEYEQAQTQNDIERLEAQEAAAQNQWDARQSAAADRAEMQQERLAQQKELSHERTETMKAGREHVNDFRKITAEGQLSTRFDLATKNADEEINATGKIAQMATAATGRRLNAIEQQSMIVLLNKFLDPGSVVREGEFNRVAAAQGLYDRAAMAVQRLQSGEVMGPHLQKEIIGLAEFYKKASQGKLQQIGDTYFDIARRSGLEPLNVIRSPYYNWKAEGGAPGVPTAGAPPVPPAMGTPQNPASLERRQTDRRTRAQGTIQWNE
jgi:hypothetical protein